MAKRTPSNDASSSEKEGETLFPCDFPIKVFGLATDEFEIAILAIVRKHIPDLRENALRSRASKDGKYLALTITVFVENRQQLDAIYQDLTKSPSVIMAL